MIAPRLYLSDYRSARNAEDLQRLGITHVVSVIDFKPKIPDCIASTNKLHISLSDLETEDVLIHLSTTTEFITQALHENETNIVLVHCKMGISRSATVVCAYIIATEKMPAWDAIEHVRTRREIIRPNFGFRKQLETYSEKYIVTQQLSQKNPGTLRRSQRLRGGTTNTTAS